MNSYHSGQKAPLQSIWIPAKFVIDAHVPEHWYISAGMDFT